VAFTAEDIYSQVPYARTLGVQFLGLSSSTVACRLEFDQALSTVGGGLHGGALMGLADVAGAVCAVLNVADGALPATSTSSTQFLRPVRGSANAAATPLYAGRSSAVVQIDVTDDAGSLCVRVTQTVSVRPADQTA